MAEVDRRVDLELVGLHPHSRAFWFAHFRDCAAEPTHGNFLLHVEGTPPPLVNAGHRELLLPADHVGPRPSGGVGGTRVGVKCLHAHYAWYLAGGDDPVGRWVAKRLEGEVDPE